MYLNKLIVIFTLLLLFILYSLLLNCILESFWLLLFFFYVSISSLVFGLVTSGKRTTDSLWANLGIFTFINVD